MYSSFIFIVLQGTVDEENFIRQFLAPGSVLVLARKDLDSQLASVYTNLSSRDWRRRTEVSKSCTTRCNIFQFLEQILHVWPIHTLEGQTENIQDALRIGFGDGDQDTRCWARKAYWAFAVNFRLEADCLLSYLDQSSKQLVEGDTSDGSFSFPGMSGTRSRQSSVDRSQDSLDGTGVGQ